MENKQMFADTRVLELASVLAGPAVGQFFAELGAEVIKIENPNTKGDVTRSWKVKGEETGDVSAYFSSVNWGKKSVSIDYSIPEGLDILYQLLSISDIVIVSFKPGDAVKLNVSYEDVKKINKEIIYGSVTGYGKNDPRVGYDAVIQAESGFMSINGESGGEPLKLPVALMDILASHQLKEALLLAYIQKLKTGKGSEVSVSLIDAAISSLANQATNWLVAGNEPKRKGSLHPNIAPYGEVFTTLDNRKVILAVGTDRQFQNLCSVLNIPLTPDFASNSKRVENRRQLFELLQRTIIEISSHDLTAELDKIKIPGGLVRSVPEALEKYNKSIINGQDLKGVYTFPHNASFSEKISHFLPPPHFAQHTHEILGHVLGLNVDEIDILVSNGIV